MSTTDRTSVARMSAPAYFDLPWTERLAYNVGRFDRQEGKRPDLRRSGYCNTSGESQAYTRGWREENHELGGTLCDECGTSRYVALLVEGESLCSDCFEKCEGAA